MMNIRPFTWTLTGFGRTARTESLTQQGFTIKTELQHTIKM